ncbi:pyridoxamine 5'-phosphate oxidase [Pilimelia columellifera]|uniref:Pyridoxine/pyridoxamine 5'-phosphate oxidase n=1 Tax=Pilimelia columellifera subsp. columellifera TaxID=706583 RepID=A0ABN3MVA9_9ACTN
MTVNTPDPAPMRRDYGGGALTRRMLAPDWRTQFGRWFADAVDADLPEPNAMVVSTADATGRPSSRTVLLKELADDALVFYTNLESRKGVEIAANPWVSLLFAWLPLHRQVVVCGRAEALARERSAGYFASRPRGSQLGAWASRQSSVVGGRAEVVAAFEQVQQRFADVEQVPMPPSWGGVRVRPETVEFWQGQTNRLHDRLRYRRDGDGWLIERLMP